MARFLFYLFFVYSIISAGYAAPAQHANPQDSPENLHWQTVAEGLSFPWAMAFLPDGSLLVTERGGTLRRITPEGKIGQSISGLPEIQTGGRGGLLGLALDPDFAENRRLYFCYSKAESSEYSTVALVRAALSADNTHLTEQKELFVQRPAMHSTVNFGCRIAFQDGYLFLTLGERYIGADQAQTLDNHLGKIVRLSPDGSVPEDNPFVGVEGALPEIWSYGHRDVQGAALDKEGRLWTTEHGPEGGDELNVIEKGKNYGWPVITYGENYEGEQISGTIREKEGMEQPRYYWNPSIAPANITFVKDSAYGDDWDGNLLVAALKARYVGRVIFDHDGEIVREERLPVGERVRDVQQGPDGNIYILIDSDHGKLLRLIID